MSLFSILSSSLEFSSSSYSPACYIVDAIFNYLRENILFSLSNKYNETKIVEFISPLHWRLIACLISLRSCCCCCFCCGGEELSKILFYFLKSLNNKKFVWFYFLSFLMLNKNYKNAIFTAKYFHIYVYYMVWCIVIIGISWMW